jgi:hypothetical protein
MPRRQSSKHEAGGKSNGTARPIEDLSQRDAPRRALNKLCATLTASTITRSKLMGEQRTQNASVSPRRVARLSARHTILDVIGYLLTNRCQVQKLLLSS